MTNQLDMENPGWSAPWIDKPWAVTSSVIPVFGETVEDIDTLEGQILADPDSYPDGYVVFVEDLHFPDEDGGEPYTTSGWVVIWDGVPMPVYFPSGTTVGGWLDNYPVPDGISTWSEDDGGWVTTVDGEPVPTNQVPAEGGGCVLPVGSNTATLPMSSQDADISIDNTPFAVDVGSITA
jgi:hypothetical protein